MSARELRYVKTQSRYDFLAELAGGDVTGFVAGVDQEQATLLPECLDDVLTSAILFAGVDVFGAALDLPGLGFTGIEPRGIGCLAYYPRVLLKLYIYGYLNHVQSSHRLERAAAAI